jgi:hypothetical protein
MSDSGRGGHAQREQQGQRHAALVHAVRLAQHRVQQVGDQTDAEGGLQQPRRQVRRDERRERHPCGDRQQHRRHDARAQRAEAALRGELGEERHDDAAERGRRGDADRMFGRRAVQRRQHRHQRGHEHRAARCPRARQARTTTRAA